ncbi:transglutaminase-like domain-containing protein [Streptomyces sp. NBC_01235]|uniref:transglutaminase-like domain-containing protein n=1 Tax=Streptomyces sp. NBC_01235 TaxID=2903788 RepID=UPI002E1000D4|nr:transglutaminase-like domain-containing protein [Streptomyces sp. NBC_01235]
MDSTRADDRHLKQTPYSDPGDLDVADLPRDPAQLTAVVRGLVLHRLEGERVGYEIPEERLHNDAESRYVTRMLRILRARKDAPLTQRRSYDEQFVGTCRDYSLLLCSLLRATGTPARVRGGFATYFVEGFHEDHWVTEYRLPDGSWRLVDPQVSADFYDVPFDPLDVPRDRFLVAGRAWRACRSGEADPETFGVWVDPGLRGRWLVLNSVVLDLAARNGVEPLPWDGWGLSGPQGYDSLTEGDLALVDAVAAARTPEEIRRLYADPRLTVPREILSWAPFHGLRRVTLASSPPA